MYSRIPDREQMILIKSISRNSSILFSFYENDMLELSDNFQLIKDDEDDIILCLDYKIVNDIRSLSNHILSKLNYVITYHLNLNNNRYLMN